MATNNPPVLQGLNSFSDESISECIMRKALLSIWIEPSLHCNYKCSYCYSYSLSRKNDIYSLENWLGILRQGFTLGVKSVVVVGGEPLLLPYLDELILGIKQHNATPVIFSNGTNIDCKKAAFFFENGCSVLLKLDSLNREVQDNLTGVKGSLNAILKALENLKEFPFNIDKANFRLGVSTVITRYNYEEIAAVWHYCRENDLFPHIEPVGFEGRAKAHFKHLMISNAEARSLYDRLLEEDETKYGFTWNRFSALPAINCKQLYYSVYVTSKGSVNVCNGISYSLGNVSETPLKEIVHSPTLDRSRAISRFMKCPTNIELGDCYGCPARAYNLLLNMFAGDPIWQPKMQKGCNSN